MAVFLVLAYTKGHHVPLPLEEGWQEEGIVITVKVLTEEESKERLGIQAREWGVQPLRFTIDNQTEESYRLTPEGIDMPSIAAKNVAKHVMRDALPRSILLKIAGFFFWPLTIPSTIEGIMTMKSYKLLHKRLLARVLHEEIIPPYTKVQRILFVPLDEYKKSFTLTLQEQENLQDRSFLIEETAPIAKALPFLQENYYATHEDS
ncbi:MAG: hypothetical protein FJZ58_03680 [Chlamydiae bacterium]|nr:hypothetical protein [Chlamydiota bacterium]